MAGDDTKLLVSIEASTKQFENALKRIEKTTNAAFKGGAANVNKLDAGMKQATASANRLERAVAATGLSTQKLAGHISTFGKGLATGILGGLGVGAVLSLGGAIGKARDALAQFDEISKSARTTGLTPEFFQALSFAAVEAGISQETLNASLLIFAKNVGLASSGTGALAAGLKKSNPELLKSINLAKTQDERLRLVAEAMRKVGDATKQTSLSTTVFGRGGAVMTELFREGAAGLDDFIKRAQALGVIIDRELLAKSDELDDQLAVLAKVIELNVNQALIHASGFLVAASTAMASFTKSVKELSDAAADGDLKKFLTTPIFGKSLVESEGAADFIVKFVNSLKGASTTLEEAEKHLAKMIHNVRTFPEMSRFVNEKEFQKLLLLETLLRQGTPNAARLAIKVLNQLAEEDFHFQSLADRFLPVLEGLLGIKEGADDAKDAIAALTASDRARTAGGEAAKTQAFIEAQKIEAAKTDFQQELERKTDEVLEAAEKLGIALTRAAAEAQAIELIGIEQGVKAAAGGGSSIETARQFIGLNENEDADVLSNLFKQAGQNIDPKMVAWCAAFVNAVLATNGVSGTNSNMARSFLNFGTPTDDPQKGDIVVLKRGDSETQGHVGFFEGKDEKGNIRVLGGNQGDGVGIDSFSPESVLGFRQIPGSDSASASAAKVIDEEVAAVKKLTEAKEDFEAMLKREGEAIDLEINSMGKSTAEQERLAVKQDLTNQLTAAGIPITEDYTRAIDELANKAAGRVTAQEAFDTAEQQSQDATQSAIDRADAIRDLSSDVIGGLASDLANGVKPAEALANALQKIAEKLLDIGINALTSGLFGPQGTSFGGIVGSLFGGGTTAAALPMTGLATGLAQGGVMTSHGPVPLKRYGSGGVAHGPQMALFGEGRTPEAFVPLPDGRSIPVRMKVPSITAAGRGSGQQRVAVDNLIKIEPSPLFDVKMESRARQATNDAVIQTPEHMADQKRRVGPRRG